MKNVFINKSLLFIFALFLVASCTKKTDEVTPAALTGKWKQNGITGKITAVNNGKTATEDLSQAPNNSIIEFKSDGTALFGGNVVKYTLSGTNLILGDASTGTLTFIAKASGNNLTLSYTKDEYFKLLDPSDPDDKSLLDLKDKITVFELNINYVKQ